MNRGLVAPALFWIVASCEVALPLPASRACTYNYECLPIGQRFEQSERVLFLCRGAEGARRCDWGLRDEDHDGEIAVGQSDDPLQRDCDDRDERRSSGRPEVLDGVDNDCDGMIDEGIDRALPAVQHALFDNAGGYRVVTDRASAWAAFHPDQRTLWLGESITDEGAARSLQIPSEFAASIHSAAIVRSGQTLSAPLLVAVAGAELTSAGGMSCATGYIGLVLATQTPSVLAADWRVSQWTQQQPGPCNARMGAVSLARTGESATSRSLLAVWSEHDGSEAAPNRCYSRRVRAGAVSIERETQLSVTGAVTLDGSSTGTRVAVRENGDGTTLIAFSTASGLSVLRVDSAARVLERASVDEPRIVDDLVFSGGASGVLAYSTRPTCAATDASVVARLVDTSAGSIVVGAAQVVATDLRLASLAVTNAPRVIDAPFARLSTNVSAGLRGAVVTWIEARSSGTILGASRLWLGDGMPVDAQPLTTGPWSDELALDERGAPSLTVLVRDESIESWLPSTSGHWSAARWQQQASAPRAY